MAADFTGIINQHANATRKDASIVDKLRPCALGPVENRLDAMGALL